MSKIHFLQYRLVYLIANYLISFGVCLNILSMLRIYWYTFSFKLWNLAEEINDCAGNHAYQSHSLFCQTKKKKDSQSNFPSICTVILHIVIPLAFYEVKCWWYIVFITGVSWSSTTTGNACADSWSRTVYWSRRLHCMSFIFNSIAVAS